jgi:hypothetical protein
MMFIILSGYKQRRVQYFSPALVLKLILIYAIDGLAPILLAAIAGLFRG